MAYTDTRQTGLPMERNIMAIDAINGCSAIRHRIEQICGLLALLALAAGCSRAAPDQPSVRHSEALHLAGLVAAYGFEEGSGARFGDASGHGNVGEISGASWVTSGKYGKALSFDGIDDWATIADAETLQLSQAFTLEAWVNPTSLSADAAVIAKETTQASSYALYARGSTNSPAALSGTTNAAGSSALPTNTWSHLAATWDGADLKLFVNGDLQSSTTLTGALFPDGLPLRLGGHQLFEHWFAGLIDEVLIFDHARSETQIESDMTTPIGGPLSGPVAALGFDEGAGSAVADATGHGHSGTISGAAWESNGKYGHALSFDGIDDWVTIADAADLDFTTQLTISAWVKVTSMDGWALVVAKEDTSNVAYSLFSSNDGDQPGGYFVSDETYVQAWGGGPIGLDTWHHLATTYDGTTLRSYINGKLSGETPNAAAIDVTSGPLLIGGSSVTGESLHGLIDEVRVYDRALSAREIGIDASTPVTAAGPPLLVAEYGFEENAGTTVADTSGVNNPGTITSASWTTAGKYGNALTFDGVDDWVTVAHDPSLDVRHTLTTMAWVKPATSGNDWQTIILKEYESEGLAYSLYANDFGDTPPAGYIRQEGLDLGVKSASSLPVDTWTHLAFTYDCSVMTLYVNGRVVGTRTQGGSVARSDAPLRIGGNAIWGEFFEGSIDEVRLYDGALTEAQIRNAMATPIGTGGGCGSGCDDGNVCNGTETCVGNACQPGTPLPSDDGNACTSDTCHPVNGVTHTPVAAGTSCANATVCDGAETCDASGACVAGAPPLIDDGNPCTSDTCDPEFGVSHSPVAAGAVCADSNVCNGAETCDAAGSCVAGAPVTIDDSNPCTVDVCDALNGVSHAPVADGLACGDPCSGTGTCDDGMCAISSPGAVIDDGDPCTEDACNPTNGGVTHLSLPSGTFCGDFCIDASCENGSCVIWADESDDGNSCTHDSCNAHTETITHMLLPAGTSCDEGNECYDGIDSCNAQGECVAGVHRPWTIKIHARSTRACSIPRSAR